MTDDSVLPEKALRYIKEGRLQVVHRDDATAMVLVRGTDKAAYRVTFNGTWQCTCKAAQHGLKCAHVAASRQVTGLKEEHVMSVVKPVEIPKVDVDDFWAREED